MTRTILILRHAEAAATSPGKSDHDRELTEFGVRQASEIGRLIAAGALPTPELALISDAARVQQTWAAASEAAGIDAPTIASRDLYGAATDELVHLLRSIPDAVACVALVGHAPEIPALARWVSDARPDQRAFIWPPATAGVIEVDADWATFPDGSRLVAVIEGGPQR